MTLSVAKLEKLFASKGFLPVKYYIIGGMCVYIELLYIKHADTFLVYIPSKYEIGISTGKNVYKIKAIDIDEEEQPADIVENTYTNVDLVLSPPKGHKEDINKLLEEKYNKPVTLNNVSKDDKYEIKDIHKQLNRLKYCTQNIKYDIGILCKNYIATIRHDEVDMYYIKNYKGEEKRSFIVIADIELFYDKIDNIYNDIVLIRNGVYSVLDKNEKIHQKMLKNMITQQINWDVLLDQAMVKKKEYERHISRFEKLLVEMNNTEKSKLKNINMIDEKYNGMESLNIDIERSHAKNKLEKELRDVIRTKDDIVKNLLSLKLELEDIMLISDKILFDNIVMIDSISKNLEKLSKISS